MQIDNIKRDFYNIFIQLLEKNSIKNEENNL